MRPFHDLEADLKLIRDQVGGEVSNTVWDRILEALKVSVGLVEVLKWRLDIGEDVARSDLLDRELEALAAAVEHGSKPRQCRTPECDRPMDYGPGSGGHCAICAQAVRPYFEKVSQLQQEKSSRAPAPGVPLPLPPEPTAGTDPEFTLKIPAGFYTDPPRHPTPSQEGPARRSMKDERGGRAGGPRAGLGVPDPGAGFLRAGGGRHG